MRLPFLRVLIGSFRQFALECIKVEGVELDGIEQRLMIVILII
jgi:hypothetical protein